MEKRTKLIIAVVVLLLITVGVLLATVFKKLNSDEIGIRYNPVLKILGENVDDEGLYFGPPGFYFITFPSIYKSIFFDDLECLNIEGIKIYLDVTYQYKVRPKQLLDIVNEFRDYDNYLKVLKTAGEAAIFESCSNFTTPRFQAERAIFQEFVRKNMRKRYEIFHTDVTDLQVNNISWPAKYESTIRSKERAREDIQVAINERPRLITKATTDQLKEETQARITIDKAISDAKILQNRAQIESEAIIAQYEREADAYEKIISELGLNFTVEGFISYLGVRVISDAKNPVYIGLQSPAKSSYRNP